MWMAPGEGGKGKGRARRRERAQKREIGGGAGPSFSSIQQKGPPRSWYHCHMEHPFFAPFLETDIAAAAVSRKVFSMGSGGSPRPVLLSCERMNIYACLGFGFHPDAEAEAGECGGPESIKVSKLSESFSATPFRGGGGDREEKEKPF